MSIEYTPGPLLDAARNTLTALWNDSSDPSELAQSISFGGVGASCNPTIAYTCINQRREAEGKDVSPIGPVVTLMVGRLDDWIKEVAKRDCLFIDPGHFERCEVAAFKRTYEPDGMTPDRNEHAGAHTTQQRSHPIAPRHCDEHRCSDTANDIDKERNRSLLTPPHRFETIENRLFRVGCGWRRLGLLR